jgi:NADH-quinone oxidoreductase subunit N
MEIYPWLNTHPLFGSLFSTVGLVMVIVGGLLAPAQRRLGPVLGYGALVDSGGALIALGMHSKLGLTLALLSLLVRPFGLALVAAGLSGLRARNGDDDSFDALRGLGWKAMWSTAALILGGLAVAGLPVNAGFVGRWALCRALMPSSPGVALFLLLAGLGVMIGVWKGLSALLERPRSPEENETPAVASEGWLTAAVLAVAILACLWVGLFPQTIAPLAARVAETYTFFVP